ncbi:nucleoside phosphorylase [Inconstantimicrobium porci]|uniref:nucleoside phosphorylase n=1 Tax=Inconstantimicrobium porci TaxID=2652291 RepID=UPI0024092C5F|nr:nucleoside phosphorylase [Inconstantimicrobium porci]MDD6772277.1 nucleoside phosphorylase [Inconstantimicrobium porci]
MILEEFDSTKNAVYNASDCQKRIEGFPKVGISCFATVTLERLLSSFNYREIARTSFANLEVPIYEIEYKGIKIAVFNSYVGAAGCIALIEDLFAMGLEKLVLFGTCGVLDGEIGDCSIVIPDSAVRDEGTSYHYMAASDEVKVNEKYIDDFKQYLDERDISYTVGKVWTTDGIYRETREKVKRRKSQGCICVDMECSAVAALGKFRGKDVLHFFYAADNLDAEEWDTRSLANNDNLDEKHKIASIALEMAVRISDN